MRSEASSVDDYLAELPPDRREALSAVRAVILERLPTGVVESMNWGMIAYEIPLATYPDTYNGQPLMYAALGSQKNHMSVYLTAVYGSESLRQKFEDAYRSTGKRLDMGKSCVRFKAVGDLPLDVIGDAIGSCTVDEFIAMFEEAAASRKTARAKK